MEITSRPFLLLLATCAFAMPAAAQTRPEGVPETAFEIDGQWYEYIGKVNGERQNWAQAQQEAARRGARLAPVESDELWARMEKQFENRHRSHTWVGGFYSNDGYIWTNGNKVDLDKHSFRQAKDEHRLYLNNNGTKFLLAAKTGDQLSGGFLIQYLFGNREKTTLPDTPHEAPLSPGPPSVRLNQTKVNGLLVMSLGSGQAGSASPMTLIALPGSSEEPSSLKFNQEVGESMQIALEEVRKFITLRYDGWPKGREMEISFENKYNPKDGPSAAVACALLLESAISGHELDPGFAVTGDMNADGSVQPIGGVEAKIRGATNRDCTHIAIPKKNLTAVYDTVLMDGIKHVVEIQVFSIANFEEAHAIALTNKPAESQRAIDEFATIQQLYLNNRDGFAQTIKHPKVIEKLSSIVTNSPNHVSAALLLSYARSQGPKTLSLHGSFSFIDENAYQIVDVIDNGKVAKLNDFDEDQVADAVALLKRNKLKLDQRTWKWADSLMRWGELMREYQTNRPKAVKNANRLVDSINAAGREVREQRKHLLEDPEVMEELLN